MQRSRIRGWHIGAIAVISLSGCGHPDDIRITDVHLSNGQLELLVARVGYRFHPSMGGDYAIDNVGYCRERSHYDPSTEKLLLTDVTRLQGTLNNLDSTLTPAGNLGTEQPAGADRVVSSAVAGGAVVRRIAKPANWLHNLSENGRWVVFADPKSGNAEVTDLDTNAPVTTFVLPLPLPARPPMTTTSSDRDRVPDLCVSDDGHLVAVANSTWYSVYDGTGASLARIPRDPNAVRWTLAPDGKAPAVVELAVIGQKPSLTVLVPGAAPQTIALASEIPSWSQFLAPCLYDRESWWFLCDEGRIMILVRNNCAEDNELVGVMVERQSHKVWKVRAPDARRNAP